MLAEQLLELLQVPQRDERAFLADEGDLIGPGPAAPPLRDGLTEEGEGHVQMLLRVALIGLRQLRIDAGEVVQREVVAGAVQQSLEGLELRLRGRLAEHRVAEPRVSIAGAR